MLQMRMADDIRGAVRIGFSSAKANLVPMVVLWGFVLTLVLSYYHVPYVARLLEPIGRWQFEYGWRSAFLNRSVFCVVLPGLFVLPMKSLRPTRPVAVLLGQAAWAGICGVVTDWMFSLNEVWFGAGTDLLTLVRKTIVVQFAWTPVFFIPVGAVVYFWLGHDLSYEKTRDEWPQHFFRCEIVPNLLVNWAVWIPATLLINLFPTVLQIQLSGFIGVVHSLMMLKIGRY